MCKTPHSRTFSKLLARLSLMVVFVGVSYNAIAAYTLEVPQRNLYGPGPFPDQQLKPAVLKGITLNGFLDGIVPGFNNGASTPNVSGEALQGKLVDGALSDQTLINENIDMGNAVIMNGQFNLLLAAVYGGPNKGDTFFYLDEHLNWWIKDDIAIDPGFPQGIVKIQDFTFSTEPRVIPRSIQKQKGYPGGTELIGSTRSGRIALGRLGDDDGDGFLDGMFNAIGQFPLRSIFLPGAPFVQSFAFNSDIPIHTLDAATLTLASARAHLMTLKKIDHEHKDYKLLRTEATRRIQKANSHLNNVLDKSLCGIGCDGIKKIKRRITQLNVLKEDATPDDLEQVLTGLTLAINDIQSIHKLGSN